MLKRTFSDTTLVNFVENPPCFALCDQILPHLQLVTPCCSKCLNDRKHPFHQHMRSRQHLAIQVLIHCKQLYSVLQFKERNENFLQSNWFPWFSLLKLFPFAAGHYKE